MLPFTTICIATKSAAHCASEENKSLQPRQSIGECLLSKLNKFSAALVSRAVGNSGTACVCELFLNLCLAKQKWAEDLCYNGISCILLTAVLTIIHHPCNKYQNHAIQM